MPSAAHSIGIPGTRAKVRLDRPISSSRRQRRRHPHPGPAVRRSRTATIGWCESGRCPAHSNASDHLETETETDRQWAAGHRAIGPRERLASVRRAPADGHQRRDVRRTTGDRAYRRQCRTLWREGGQQQAVGDSIVKTPRGSLEFGAHTRLRRAASLRRRSSPMNARIRSPCAIPASTGSRDRTAEAPCRCRPGAAGRMRDEELAAAGVGTERRLPTVPVSYGVGSARRAAQAGAAPPLAAGRRPNERLARHVASCDPSQRCQVNKRKEGWRQR